jgi:hypothetical protein
VKPKKIGLTQRVLGTSSKQAAGSVATVDIEECISEQLLLGDIDLCDKSKYTNLGHLILEVILYLYSSF